MCSQDSTWHAVRSVEDRLAIPLFARTTRSVSLTEAGARFVAGVEPALTDIDQTVEGLTAERGEVTGLLRIDAPRGAFDMALPPILAKLAREHPRLTVEVRTGQTSVDIVAQGFDAGVRLRRAIQQDMVTTRLTGPFKLILVASRDYLDARGTPKSIADLYQHNCIGMHDRRIRRNWRLGTDRREEADSRENVGYGFGDRCYGGAQFGFGRRRDCLCRRTAGAPIPSRRQPSMAAAPDSGRA